MGEDSLRIPDSEPLVGNTADEAQIRRAKKIEKQKENDEISDILDVLNLDAGRRFLYGLLDYCCVWHSCYDPDITLMSHKVGRQDVGHWIMQKITDANPEMIGFMHQEHARQMKENSKKE